MAEDKEQAVRHYVQGYSLRSIARVLGRDPGTVRRWLRAAGVQMRRNSPTLDGKRPDWKLKPSPEEQPS